MAVPGNHSILEGEKLSEGKRVVSDQIPGMKSCSLSSYTSIVTIMSFLMGYLLDIYLWLIF